MTCKDCIHYCLCKDTLADENWGEDTPQKIKDMYSPKGCENFENKEDFKEVKHGKWLEHDYEHYIKPDNTADIRPILFRCSVCGRTENQKEPYCNCGAEMDKERE